MELWRKSFSNKIRNIKLVPVTDEGFQSFFNDIKLEYYHLRDCNKRSVIELISHPLEKTVRVWAKQSGAGIDERVISYELLMPNNTYGQRYKEIDFILLRDGTHYLGEIKVSTRNKMAHRASKQLISAYNLMSQAGFKTELMIVFIDLNYKNMQLPINPFENNFLDSDFTRLEFDGLSYSWLHLEPCKIFDWGLKIGTITDPTFLSRALEESENFHKYRKMRRALKAQNVPVTEWPAELKDSMVHDDDEDHTLVFKNDTRNNLFTEKLKEALNRKPKL